MTEKNKKAGKDRTEREDTRKVRNLADKAKEKAEKKPRGRNNR